MRGTTPALAHPLHLTVSSRDFFDAMVRTSVRSLMPVLRFLPLDGGLSHAAYAAVTSRMMPRIADAM